MLARLQSNKIPAVLVIAFLCLSCAQLSFSRDNHEGGLFEIRIRHEAEKFLRAYNAANATDWGAWNAEMSDVVPGCKEPIQAKWEQESSQDNGKNVLLQCSKTVNNDNWTVKVPVRKFGYSIEKDRTTDRKHGLYEIREEARLFISEYNKKNHTHWASLDPDLRIMVPKCIVPLRTKWNGRKDSFAEVICTKINPISFRERSNWTVKVRVACDLPPEKRSNQCRM